MADEPHPAYVYDLLASPRPFAEVDRLQLDLAAARSQGAVPDTIVLCEHPPTLTLGRASDAEAELLEGEAAYGANMRPARPPQLVLLGPGEDFAVTDAAPGTRFMLMAGQPYGETPLFNGAYVD